jgi:hypothetical protein
MYENKGGVWQPERLMQKRAVQTVTEKSVSDPSSIEDRTSETYL